MTLNQTARQLHKLSKGRINGEKFTIQELKEVLAMWMRDSDTYIGRITLPDGEWFFLVDRFPYDKKCFGYYIPDTREHEKDFVKNFLGLEI